MDEALNALYDKGHHKCKDSLSFMHLPGPPPESLFGKISGAALMLACWLMGIGYIIASIPDKK